MFMTTVLGAVVLYMVHSSTQTGRSGGGYWAIDERGCVGVQPITPESAARLIQRGRARRIGPNVVLVHKVFDRVATERDVRRLWWQLGPAVCRETPQGANWPYFSEVLARAGERRPSGRRRYRIDVACARRVTYLAAYELRTERRRWANRRALEYQQWCLEVLGRHGRGHETVRQRWRATLVGYLRRKRVSPAIYHRALRVFDALWDQANPSAQPKIRRRMGNAPRVRPSVVREFGRRMAGIGLNEAQGASVNPTLEKWCLGALAHYGKADPERIAHTLRHAVARAVLVLDAPRATKDTVLRLALRRFNQMWRAAGNRPPKRKAEPSAPATTARPMAARSTSAQRAEKRVIVLLARPEGASPLKDVDQHAIIGAMEDATTELGGFLQTWAVTGTGSAVQLTAIIPAAYPTARYVQHLRTAARAVLPTYLGRLWAEYFYAVIPSDEQKVLE